MIKTPYPMTFDPVYKDYPWGGTRIPETYGRNLPPGIYAESWEIADRDDGMSIVSNGPHTGKSLHEVVQENPAQLLGSNVMGDAFPLLIKLIDAKKKLSVQVHPDDRAAAEYGGEAKTEMWYMLGKNDAQVFCGLKEGVTRESFRQAAADGTSGETMRPVPVRQGDAVFVRGGRVHAIDEGCLILEIQQNSNTTYRIYDWGRVGNDGNPRELHIDQALKVINWNDSENPLIEPVPLIDTETLQCWRILECEYFHVEKIRLSAPLEIPMDGSTFHALFVVDGNVSVEWDSETLPAPAGRSVLIPAGLPAYALCGNATLLRITAPGIY